MLGQIWANSWFCNQRHVDFWGSPALKQALVSEHFPYQACTFNDGVFTRQQLTLTNIPEGQMDGRLCRHGWNKQRRLPHFWAAWAAVFHPSKACVTDFRLLSYILPSAVDGLRFKSHQTHQRSEGGSLRTSPTIMGTSASSLSAQLLCAPIKARWTSNYHLRPHHLSSGLWRCSIALFVSPYSGFMAERLGAGLHQFLAQSKHVFLWCSGLHALQKRTI